MEKRNIFRIHSNTNKMICVFNIFVPYQKQHKKQCNQKRALGNCNYLTVEKACERYGLGLDLQHLYLLNIQQNSYYTVFEFYYSLITCHCQEKIKQDTGLQFRIFLLLNYYFTIPQYLLRLYLTDSHKKSPHSTNSIG